MSKERDNKATIGRWFTGFLGEKCNLGIVDELAAPNMLLQYSLHEPRRGRDDIKAFMTDFREAFPDLNFWVQPTLIAEGDYVVGCWDGGTTGLKLERGKIVSEIRLDDGVTALTQLGLIRAV